MRAQRGTVNAEWRLGGVVAGFELEAEALGYGEVHLVGGDSEFAAGDAVHLHVDLWSVKRGLIRHFHKINARLDEHLAHHVLGLYPQFRFADVFVAKPLGAVRAEAHAEFLEPENLEILEVHLVHSAELVGELLRCAVNVRVVHLHRAHAHEAHQFAGALVAVTGAILGQAQRQFPVTAWHRRENLVVMRAVHRLEIDAVGRLVRIVILEFHRWEHALGIVGEMAGSLVHAFPRQVRRTHALVACLELRLLGQFLQFLDQHRALGQPERQAGADVVVEREQLHLAADLAVVPLARLLLRHEPLVELRLVRKRGAVDTLQLRVILVAAVVGGGNAEQLVGLGVAGAHDVRPGAEIDELAVLVE